MSRTLLESRLQSSRCCDANHLIGQTINIPIIVPKNARQHFTDTGLPRDDKCRIVMGGFKRGQTKWLADRAHNKYIADSISIAPLLAADKASEEDFVSYT